MPGICWRTAFRWNEAVIFCIRKKRRYFYRKIIELSPSHLADQGMLAFEIGYDQGESVAELMRKKGFQQVEVKKDLAGLDRIVTGHICHNGG